MSLHHNVKYKSKFWEGQPMTYMITKDESNNTPRHMVTNGIQITSKRNCSKRVNLMTLNLNSFNMEPGSIVYSDDFFSLTSLTEKKKYYISLLKKGVTTIAVSYKVSSVNNLLYGLKKARHELINCPIDFIIGIKVDIKYLTPVLIRKSNRLKIPFIIVEMNSETFNHDIAWEWIRNENFPRPICFIPEWKDHDDQKNRDRFKQVKKWDTFTQQLNLHSTTRLDDFLSVKQLKAIGVYPKKGILNHGSDLDYKLIYRNEMLEVEETTNTIYDSNHPNIVVLRGQLMKVNDTIYYRPGFGREVQPTLPGQFASFD